MYGHRLLRVNYFDIALTKVGTKNKWFLILQMALLHRFLRLNDAGQTGIFTFIVTRSVTRDLHRDIMSKEFR